MGICRGCNQEKQLVDAHIIPESFFKEIDEPGGSSILFEARKGSHKKRRPKGIYDKSILCMDCEKRFQLADEYAQKLLLQSIKLRKVLILNGKEYGFYFDDFNFNLLKRFVISLLWRASISKDVFYSKINLGSFETRAKELIWNDCVGSNDEFDFFFCCVRNLASKLIVQPVPRKHDDINIYKFYLGEIILYIKVDKRKFDPNPFLVRDGKPLYFISTMESDNKAMEETMEIVRRSISSH